jgi:hypothetical protein
MSAQASIRAIVRRLDRGESALTWVEKRILVVGEIMTVPGLVAEFDPKRGQLDEVVCSRPMVRYSARLGSRGVLSGGGRLSRPPQQLLPSAA